jgi:hypothetical protein
MAERDPIETLRALLSEAARDEHSIAVLTARSRALALAPRLLAVVEAAERWERYRPRALATTSSEDALAEALDALRADAAEVLR